MHESTPTNGPDVRSAARSLYGEGDGPRERIFAPEEWDEWATMVEEIIVREVGILSHARERVIDPLVNVIELAYGRGLDDERI